MKNTINRQWIAVTISLLIPIIFLGFNLNAILLSIAVLATILYRPKSLFVAILPSAVAVLLGITHTMQKEHVPPDVAMTLYAMNFWPVLESAGLSVAAYLATPLLMPLLKSKPMDDQSYGGRNALIDYARLILAACVMLGHTRDTLGLWPFKTFPFFAVPAFLAISGYYILQSYEHSKNWFHFAWKRILRVIPAFLFSLVICAFAGGIPTVLASLKVWITAGLIQVGSAGNGPLWSLMLEEVCYALLAVLFTVGVYRAKWPIWILFIGSIFTSGMLSGSGNHTYPYAQNIIQTYPAFFAGSLVYIHKEYLKKYALMGLLLMILSIATVLKATDGFSSSFWSWSWNPFPLVTAMMGVGIVLWLSNVRSKAKIPFDISYSIYVYHMAIALIFYRYHWSWLIYLPLLLATCIFSWFFIESPALKYKDFFFKKR